MDLKEQLINYVPFNEQEHKDKELILKMMDTFDDIFERSNTTCHITTSGWVLNKEHTKLLLAYHNLYDSWAWLGGHNDGNENCLEVALKEVKEESGIEKVRPILSSIYSIEVLTVDGHVKKGEYVSSHLHLNVTYLLEADDTERLTVKEDENSAVAWFDIEKAVDMSNEKWFRDNIYSKLNKKLKNYI